MKRGGKEDNDDDIAELERQVQSATQVAAQAQAEAKPTVQAPRSAQGGEGQARGAANYGIAPEVAAYGGELRHRTRGWQSPRAQMAANVTGCVATGCAAVTGCAATGCAASTGCVATGCAAVTDCLATGCAAATGCVATGGAAVTGWVTCGSGPAAIELVSLCSACRPAESISVYFQLLVTETAPWPERSSSGAALHAAHRATLEGMPA